MEVYMTTERSSRAAPFDLLITNADKDFGQGVTRCGEYPPDSIAQCATPGSGWRAR